MKEEEKITIKPGKPGFCSINTYFDDNHKHLPTLIVDNNEWDWIETNYIKDGKGWFAKTIGMTHIYKRRSKNVFYRFDDNIIELKDCPNGRFIYIDSSGNHALGFKGVEYSITGPKPSAECFRHLFPDIADDVFDNEGKLISLRLFQLVYPLRDDDEYPGNLMTKTQVDPESGLDITFATDNPKYDVETGTQNVHFGMPPEEPQSDAVCDSQSKLYSFNKDGMLVVHHPFPLKYPGLTPEVCAQIMEQKPKRKYTKNKLHKRKKHTKKNKG